MLQRLLTLTVWLMVGHAILAGLYWSFINVSEATIWTLALSALLIALMIVTAATIEATAIRWWQRPTPVFLARAAGAALPALVVFALAWWLTARADRWWQFHRGEIDAWLIATFDLTASGWLHAGERGIIWFARYGVGVSLALGLFAAALDNLKAALAGRWILRAVAPIRLLWIAGCLLLFIWLPWRARFWRPDALPPTWLEVAFAVAKIGAIYTLANIGWALALQRVTARYESTT